ncbi:MAG: Fe-S cluster assembly protein SufD [Candidatus Marinimicrobia bacterium]|nr:Fe-S cluster assembly protein SufD [Candidatus Neomarinimicrobiota bacterium]
MSAMNANETKQHFLRQLDAWLANPEHRDTPIHRLRQAARERLDVSQFPTTKNEDWKYTNLKPFFENDFHFAPQLGTGFQLPDAKSYQIHADAWTMVFVNGHFQPAASRLDGLDESITLVPLDKADTSRPDSDLVRILDCMGRTEEDIFSDLATAFLHNGVYLHIPKNVKLDKPIHLVYLSTDSETPFFTAPRNIIALDQGAEAVVTEHFQGAEGAIYHSNPLTQILVAENANLTHNKLGLESEYAYHVGRMVVNQSQDSRFSTWSFTLGGRLVRNEIDVLLDGSGSEVHLNGLYIATGEQHMDNQTYIDHAVPHTTSTEHYRGVMNDHGHGVFTGRVLVRQDAQKTDAQQMNKNLLLSKTAQADTRPQLEIFADDVKASHGATVGQLDEDQIFYLRSRGIGEAAARHLLTQAFANEIVDSVPHEEMGNFVHSIVNQRLS